MEFPEPTTPRASRDDVLVEYLDYFRGRVASKVAALPDDVARTSQLPSRWTPLELVRHLTFMERRWFEWGFAGRDVGDPWGDEHDGRWFADPDVPVQPVLAELALQGERTRAIVADHDLSDVGQPGPRWEGAEPPTLERVLLHVMQEYARHLGQLDIAVELAGGATGE